MMMNIVITQTRLMRERQNICKKCRIAIDFDTHNHLSKQGIQNELNTKAHLLIQEMVRSQIDARLQSPAEAVSSYSSRCVRMTGVQKHM